MSLLLALTGGETPPVVSGCFEFDSTTFTFDRTDQKWDQTVCPTVTPPVVIVQAGGRGGKRRRIVVEINGQIHYVRDEDDAVALIDASRVEIKKQIKLESPKLVKVINGNPVAKKPKIRVISGSSELKAHAVMVTQELRTSLQMMIDRLIIEAIEAENDDEEVLLLG
jgi:hypothetical protein